jgi:hypothetical protein
MLNFTCNKPGRHHGIFYFVRLRNAESASLELEAQYGGDGLQAHCAKEGVTFEFFRATAGRVGSGGFADLQHHFGIRVI